MKKILFTIAICLAAFGVADAQYSYGSSASRLDSIENALSSANTRMAELRADSIHNYIWANSTHFDVGYAVNSTSTDVYERQNAKFGVFIDFNHNYLFPKSKAWGNVVKVGLNVRWIDLDFAMYDDFYRQIKKSQLYEYGSGWVGDISEVGVYPDRARFKQMTILLGALGVGPTITVAPFTFMDNALAALKLNLYFHYQPTFGVNMYLVQPEVVENEKYVSVGNKDTKFEYGYVSMMDLGFRLQWRNIGLGVEGRWGSGKLTSSTYSPYVYYNDKYTEGYEININGAKDPSKNYTRKFGETRIYFDVAF